MPRWVNVPNGITALRLALVPLVIAAIAEGRYAQALGLFAAAAATDVLDGAAARRWGAVTQVGAYLDPVADKCLLSGVFVALAAAGAAPWWLVAAIFGRDLYILLGAAAALRWTRLRKFPPSIWGKISTFVQIVTALSMLARGALGGAGAEGLAAAMPWPCAAFTAYSGADYTWRIVRNLRRIDANPAQE